MPNIPLDKDLNEPLIREGIKVVRKVNEEFVTEYKDINSGKISEDDLLDGLSDNDFNGPPSGIGVHMDERTGGYEPLPRVTSRNNDEVIQQASENSQRFIIIKNAIKAVIKQPEVKEELSVDWYEDQEYREVIAEAVLEAYGTLGFGKKEILETINQIYN